MAYDFEESSSQRITFTPNADFSSTVSISFWAKCESLPGSHQMHFIDKGKNNSGADRNFSVFWTPASGGTLGVSWDNPSGSYHEWTNAMSPTVGVWQHWYIEIDWTTNPDTVLLWIDGVSITLTNTFGSNNNNPLTTATQQISIGAEHGSADNVNNFDGLMSDVAIWSDIIGAARASSLYNSGFGKKAATAYPTNLVEDITLRLNPNNDKGGNGTLSSSPPSRSSDNPFPYVYFSNINNGSEADGDSTATTSSVLPLSNNLILVTVGQRTNISADPNIPSLTGNGLTWELVDSIVYDTTSSTRRRVSLFRSMGASPSTGAITIDCGGQNQTNITYHIDEVTGVDTSGSNGSGAIIQSETNKDEGTPTGLSINLAAFGSVDNVTFGAFATDGNETFSPGSGFTLLTQVSSGTNIDTCTEYKNANDTVVDISVGIGSPMGGIAIEIKAAVVSVSPTVLSSSFSLLSPTPVISGGGGGAVSVSPTVLSAAWSILSPNVFIPSTYTKKIYIYKVYDNNALVAVWSDDVISSPTFVNAINQGAGELRIKLARDFDNYGEDSDVKFSNRVDVYCFDRDNAVGLLIYRGFISAYTPTLQSGREFVEVTLLPYSTQAASYPLKTADGATSVPYLSKDPGYIFQQVLSLFQSQGGILGSTPSSIALSGTTVSYTFNTNTIKEGFDKCLELAPEFWYYSIDPDGTVHFQQRSTAVTHDLSIGQHIVDMKPEKRIEGIVNRVYFTGGGDPPLYMVVERSSSIAAWGLKSIRVVDQRVTDVASATIMINRILNQQDSPETRIRLTVLDNNGVLNQGYDIESIKVGDTVRIKNLQFGQKSDSYWDDMEWDTDVWDETLASIAGSALLIVKTTYNGNYLDLEASSRFPVVAKRIEDINRNLENTQTVNNPSTPS